MLRAMWLSVLPWGFVLMGLVPLWLFPRQEILYPGVIYLVGSLILTATASLYARATIGPWVRFYWVMGLSMLAFVTALESARDLVVLPQNLALGGGVASLMAGALLLVGLYFSQHQEARSAGSLQQSKVTSDGGVLYAGDLQSLAPALEAMAAVRPVTLLMLQTPSGDSGKSILHSIRQPDLVFELKPRHYLVALQGSNTDGAAIAFRRLRQSLEVQAYAVMPLHGKTLKEALKQLEGELEHFYLTQSPT